MFGNMTRAKMLEVLGVVPGDGAGMSTLSIASSANCLIQQKLDQGRVFFYKLHLATFLGNPVF